MKKQLGIKSSFSLIVCRIVSIFLFVAAIGGAVMPYLMEEDISDMSDEYKAELMNTPSFRIATRVAFEMIKKPEKYGDLEDVTSIEYSDVLYSTSLSSKTSSIKLVKIIKKGSEELCLNYSKNYSLITVDEYDNYNNSSGKYSFSRSKSKYDGVELKLIKHIAQADDAENTIFEWDKEEITSTEAFYYIKQVFLQMPTLFDYKNSITSITCSVISSLTKTADIKIDISGGSDSIYLRYQIDAVKFWDSFGYIENNATVFRDREVDVLLNILLNGG